MDLDGACPGPAVAIIGGGFSGTMTAIRLRRLLPSVRVHLFDARGQFGQGPAYAPTDAEALLNVRSAGMSAFGEQPADFERWLTAQDGAAPTAFARRALYGRYLAALLAAESGDGLVLERDQVLRLEREGAGWRLGCAGGRTLTAAAAVIAAGNLPAAATQDGIVFCNPWAPETVAGLRAGVPVMIVGTGLTMVDLVRALRVQGFAGPVLAVSRRGLVPQAHAAVAEAWPADPAVRPGLGVLALLRAIRSAVRTAAAQGVDWRAVIDGLRPVTVALWQGLAPAERARFLRHMRPYWDTHRHRMAPDAARDIEAMRATGALRVMRGRVEGIEPAEGPGAVVRLHRAGTVQRVAVQRVIYATGAGAGLATDPLLAGLLADGTMCADSNGLGLRVADSLAALDAAGRTVPGLWALGPMVRGNFWECTAVPDIRVHAMQVAAEVAAFLRTGPA